jgi:hypothetical protein
MPRRKTHKTLPRTFRVPGVLYSQRDGFTVFEPPAAPPQPGGDYDRQRVDRLGWTSIAVATWATHHPEYPIVFHSGAISHRPFTQLEIWFGSYSDYVHYCHQHLAPQRVLELLGVLQFRVDCIYHELHGPTYRDDCRTCEDIEHDAAMYGSDPDDERDRESNAHVLRLRPEEN